MTRKMRYILLSVTLALAAAVALVGATLAFQAKTSDDVVNNFTVVSDGGKFRVVMVWDQDTKTITYTNTGTVPARCRITLTPSLKAGGVNTPYTYTGNDSGIRVEAGGKDYNLSITSAGWALKDSDLLVYEALDRLQPGDSLAFTYSGSGSLPMAGDIDAPDGLFIELKTTALHDNGSGI